MDVATTNDKEGLALKKRFEIGESMYELCKEVPTAMNLIAGFNSLDELDLNQIPVELIQEKVKEALSSISEFKQKTTLKTQKTKRNKPWHQ